MPGERATWGVFLLVTFLCTSKEKLPARPQGEWKPCTSKTEHKDKCWIPASAGMTSKKSSRVTSGATRYNETVRGKKLYKVTFLSQGKTLELYARYVGSSALWGFTEVGELVFEQGDGVVVDPTEERLRDEFKNTKMLHLPMQCIVRIEEVEKIGPVAIRDAASGDKIMPFPIAPPRSSGK